MGRYNTKLIFHFSTFSTEYKRDLFDDFIYSVHSVHPCDMDNSGGCDQICTKKGHEAVCSCKNGFQVSKTDAKKCEQGRICVNCVREMGTCTLSP